MPVDLGPSVLTAPTQSLPTTVKQNPPNHSGIKRELSESSDGDNVSDSTSDDSECDIDLASHEQDDNDRPLVTYDTFKIPPGLPSCQDIRYTVKELHRMLNEPGLVNLCPVYQRDVVWSTKNQSALVDSIIRGYYIPPIIFNRRVDIVNGTRKPSLVCIDGKQRLTALLRFTQGKIKCSDHEGSKWSLKRLPEEVRDKFWNTLFFTIEYNKMTEAQEHDLFERVQQGNPLRPAEKAQAKQGQWQDLTHWIMELFPTIVDLSANKRAAGFDKILSSLAQLEEQDRARKHGGPTSLFKGDLRHAESWFLKDSTSNPCTPALQHRAIKVFGRFDTLVSHNIDPATALGGHQLPNRSVLAPIEFIAIVCLIDRHGDTMTDDELRATILSMRLHVRTKFDKNLRRNQQVWNALWEPVRELGKASVEDCLAGSVSDAPERRDGSNPRALNALSQDELSSSDSEDEPVRGHGINARTYRRMNPFAEDESATSHSGNEQEDKDKNANQGKRRLVRDHDWDVDGDDHQNGSTTIHEAKRRKFIDLTND